MRNKFQLIGSAAGIVVVIAGLTFWGIRAQTSKGHADALGDATPTSSKPVIQNPTPELGLSVKGPILVMGIGGSVAHGWDDKTGGGYLARAFQTLSKEQSVQYHFVNKSIEGDGPTQMATRYPGFLVAIKPAVVIISWGMLDDLSKKTPVKQFRQAIHTEIADALADKMDVIVVTPPVTGASLSAHDNKPDLNLIDIEMSTAEQFHSQHVYVFDVFRQMEAYMKAHHQTISMYAADGWHPNSAGHELAGRLLAQDLRQHFVVKSPSPAK